MDAPSSTPVTPPVSGDLSGITSDTSGKSVPAAKPELKAAASSTTPADKAASVDAKDAKEVKAAIEKIKLKSGEYSAEEIESLIEKSKGADKKFLEAAKAKKEAIRFFKMAKENPREFLAKTGLDPKKFAYDEVAQDLKDKLRDPKEVELEQAQKRLKDYEAKEAAAEQAKKEEKMSREAKAFEQKLHSEMIDALESFPELPKNGFTVAALARAIDTVREKTGQLLTAKEVAPKVVNDIRQMVSGIVKGSNAEQLIALIGEEGMATIRKHDIAKLKNPLANGQGNNLDGTTKERPVHKKMRSHDFWNQIDEDVKKAGGQ